MTTTYCRSNRSTRRCILACLFALTSGCEDLSPSQAPEETQEPSQLLALRGAVDAAVRRVPPSFCAVYHILDDAYCAACHDGTGRYAPLSLARYSDYLKASPHDPQKKVYDLVAARIHDVERPMPVRGLLNRQDLQTLDDWIDAGAPFDTTDGGILRCPYGDVGPLELTPESPFRAR